MGKNNQRGLALVTGATGGLGKAFVMQLAERDYDLFLTGRSADKLAILKAHIKAKNPQINVYTQEADLTKLTGRKTIIKELKKYNLKISVLVNVAGADIQKALTEYTQEKISFQCRVNFEAAVSMCHFAIENKAEELFIVNISSVSGIYPMPYFAIYSATKSALTSFSVALREEMKGKGVYVTAVLPGAMPTRDDVKAQIKGQGLWGKLAAKSPEFVARKSLEVVAQNKAKYIPGFWNKAMRISTSILPSKLRLAFIAKRWSKISKDSF